jgi:Kdo2-lipid IVA lauroyltransferase/acyltransferase
VSEPLRRRLRARALDGLRFVPPAAIGGLARLAVPLASFSRYEQRCLANLELALGAEIEENARRRIARGVRLHTARLVEEWTRLARATRSPRELVRTRAWLEEHTRFDDSLSILERCRSAGCVLVTAHLGNWELLAPALRRLGVDGTVVGFQKRNDSAAQRLVAMRAALGVATTPQDAAPRHLLELLRGGQAVGLLADLEARRIGGCVVPFFGRPAWTMTAPGALARAARVPVLPVRCVAQGESYLISFEEPLAVDERLSKREGANDMALRLNGIFESWIRAAPEQWAWHQRRWRNAEELEALARRT